MKIEGARALVTGAASGLGRATAIRLAGTGAVVTVLDLPSSDGHLVAQKIGGQFAPADVTDETQVAEAVAMAAEGGALRVLVHCAGRGGPVRVVDREGNPGSLSAYRDIVNTNLIGTFNVLRLVAAEMAKADESEGERGVCVLTASIAGYEGQIGQIPYASSKAGVIGMTLVAARDLARRKIRVCSIAPGVFDTPMLGRLRDEVRQRLGDEVPHPSRLGRAEEYAALAEHIVTNPMINGETIRLDGALRMAPR
jgi:NAD(P)-dependent dehydrogenase (short-subunit alcohol dehydrogenase family)